MGRGYDQKVPLVCSTTCRIASVTKTTKELLWCLDCNIAKKTCVVKKELQGPYSRPNVAKYAKQKQALTAGRYRIRIRIGLFREQKPYTCKCTYYVKQIINMNTVIKVHKKLVIRNIKRPRYIYIFNVKKPSKYSIKYII